MRRSLFALIILGLLVASVPYDLSRSMLPFYSFWGVDFQNLYAFHHCTLRDHPYDDPRAATVCEDAVNRPMRYPPLLYWSFLWTRPLSYPVALHLWVLFILIGTFLGVTCFLPTAALAERKVLLFVGLLFVQFPALYALERANNDVWIVLLWGLAYVAFARGRLFASGAIAGVAVAAKVYPLFALAVVVLALIRDRRALMRFTGGVLTGGSVVCLLFFTSTRTYVEVLRVFAAETPGPSLSSHGLTAFFSPIAAAIFAGALIVTWAAAGHRLYAHAQYDLLFAGALAISTYFSKTSNDYNLITTYPLLAVLLLRSLEPRALLMRISLIVCLAGLVAPRILFLQLVHQHVLLQVLGLILAGAAALRSFDEPAGPTAAVEA